MDLTDNSYKKWLQGIKEKIKTAQLKVAVSANAQLIELYWELAEDLIKKEKEANWGDSIIEQLSIDLRLSFPNVSGFSRRNLYAIRQWYLFYSEQYPFVPRAVAQIPWGHNRLIVSKLKDIEQAMFYCRATVENSWSRDNLEMAIKSKYFEAKGKAITNFEQTLPKPHSGLAAETLKNPYNFDFLGLEEDAMEREIENAMIEHISRFLIELGKGFAFVGRQYQLVVGGNEYYLDLLFYHLQLRSYMVVELKAGRFKPEHTGKLNFYLSAIDSQLKHPQDNPTIGLILCKHKDKIEAEYALRDINKPIGISEYILTQALPKEIQSKLPTVEQLENHLNIKDDDS